MNYHRVRTELIENKHSADLLAFQNSQRYLIADRLTANTAGDFVQSQLQWVSQDGKMNPSESIKWEDTKYFFSPFFINQLNK